MKLKSAFKEHYYFIISLFINYSLNYSKHETH